MTTRRTDFEKVNKLLPFIAFTGDSNHIYWNLSTAQYKAFKGLFPDHVKFKMPKP